MSKTLNLKVGYLCNNDCLFCAQSDRRELGNPSKELLMHEMRLASKDRKKIVFTGGEPTVRKDLLELIAYAREIGFERLQLQSNVRKLKSYHYCNELISAGINEFAPSLHGHNPDIHNLHTKRDKSFSDTITALENLATLGQYVITNTVITSLNYKHLNEIAKILISQKVAQIQFAYVHSVGSGAINIDRITPTFSEIIPFVFSAIKTVINHDVKCMVESIPLCLMKDFKSYCSEYFMPDIEVRDTHYVDQDFESTRKNKLKTKPPKCQTCYFYRQCEGPWIEYIEKFGNNELCPVAV